MPAVQDEQIEKLESPKKRQVVSYLRISAYFYQNHVLI